MKILNKEISKRKWGILAAVEITLAIMATYGVVTFFQTHGLRTPIILQAPIYTKTAHIVSPLQKASPKPSKKPTSLVPQVVPVALAEEKTDSFYKLYIYQHESGIDPKKYNSAGCVGLGQACPSSKLLAVCPNLDYGCEDEWFSNYAVSRYGSWQKAYNFWLVNSWW